MVKFDSNEEMYFSWYLDELVKRGYISNIFPQGITYQLSDNVKLSWWKRLKTKSKPMTTVLLQDHVYTPDFVIHWNDTARDLIFSYIHDTNNNSAPFVANKDKHGRYYSVIEVKPNFDQNNMTRAAMINIKWVWYKYNVFIQKVIVIPNPKGKPKSALFPATFTPSRYMYTDVSNKARKIKFEVTTADKYIKQRKALMQILNT